MIFLFCFLFIIKSVYSQECYDDGNEFCIEQDDILSVDLLPGSFILMDQNLSTIESRSSKDVLVDGSFVKALDEMEYHR